MNSDSEHDLPIPFGWYCVGYSDELAPGEVQRLRYFGEDRVLFRTESGVACLVDAHCPHLGAHLAQARVEGEALRCAFHAWCFDTQGSCVDIPYAKKIPAKLREEKTLTTHPLIEKNQLLWAWHHPHGADPLFPLQEFEEISSGEWSDYQKFDWKIRTHVQETGENAVDSAHFLYVHEVGGILEDPVIRFDGHLRHSDLALNFKRPSAEAKSGMDPYVAGRVLTSNSGPGQTWTRQTGFTDLVLLGLPTPIESGMLHLRFAFSMPNDQGESKNVIAQLILQNIVDQVEQDLPIWEHKIYRPTPKLCDGDGPIAQYRKWFSQFYAD